MAANVYIVGTIPNLEPQDIKAASICQFEEKREKIRV